MMGGPSGGGRTGMKKTGLLKRAGVAVMTAALMVTAVACNTKIKVNFEAKASDYVKLAGKMLQKRKERLCQIRTV